MITAVTLLLGPPVSLGLSLQHPAIPPPLLAHTRLCPLAPAARWLGRWPAPGAELPRGGRVCRDEKDHTGVIKVITPNARCVRYAGLQTLPSR